MTETLLLSSKSSIKNPVLCTITKLLLNTTFGINRLNLKTTFRIIRSDLRPNSIGILIKVKDCRVIRAGSPVPLFL